MRIAVEGYDNPLELAADGRVVVPGYLFPLTVEEAAERASLKAALTQYHSSPSTYEMPEKGEDNRWHVRPTTRMSTRSTQLGEAVQKASTNTADISAEVGAQVKKT